MEAKLDHSGLRIKFGDYIAVFMTKYSGMYAAGILFTLCDKWGKEVMAPDYDDGVEPAFRDVELRDVARFTAVLDTLEAWQGMPLSLMIDMIWHAVVNGVSRTVDHDADYIGSQRTVGRDGYLWEFRFEGRWPESLVYDFLEDNPGCQFQREYIPCGCMHCRNDWDCCGNFIAQNPRVVYKFDSETSSWMTIVTQAWNQNV